MSYVITDREFWQTVAELGWGTKSTDTNELSIVLMKKGIKYCNAFRNQYNKFAGGLYDLLEDIVEGVGDDGFSDLIAHIIGLGKEEYEKVLDNPTIVQARIDANDYVENFSYCIPWEDSWTDHNIDNLKERAVEFVCEYQNAIERLDTIKREVENIRLILMHLVNDNIDAFLKHDCVLIENAKTITKRYDVAVQKLMGPHFNRYRNGGDVLDVYYGVENLVSDVKRYLILQKEGIFS